MVDQNLCKTRLWVSQVGPLPEMDIGLRTEFHAGWGVACAWSFMLAGAVHGVSCWLGRGLRMEFHAGWGCARSFMLAGAWPENAEIVREERRFFWSALT